MLRHGELIPANAELYPVTITHTNPWPLLLPA